jgi:tripartite-type tricarboxylate transporter receptor subunit TctC
MVMAGSGSLAISATMYKKLPYDPIKDFIPLALGARIPFILVANPSLPVRSVAELVQYAKQNPGTLSFASGGPGSPHHLYAELLKSMTGIEMTHVPYKGLFELHRATPSCQIRLHASVVGLSSSLEVHQPPRACG